MLFRYNIYLRSPLITPLMSDTFFGHFCWWVVYNEGEEALMSLLQAYGNGQKAPVLFSSAFPADHLPRPVTPPPSRENIRELVNRIWGETSADRLEGLSRIKTWHKQPYIAIPLWQKLKDRYSDLALYQAFHATEPAEIGFLSDVTTSNTINRISGTVNDGGLFAREKKWRPAKLGLDLYVQVNSPAYEPLVNAFLTEHLPQNGFGADKSLGMGVLEIRPDQDFDSSMFDIAGSNARISLSLAAFDGMESIDAYYHLQTKFGKLGGNFATSSPSGGNPRPFKKPVLMYGPGAVFLCQESLNDRPLLKNVHSDTRIRHCGVPLTIPLYMKQN